ncbi:hypothetical protein DPMN_064236 [Dreissena polymorpha]|uniref:Uncharacterized protein n=1 Tax=Dreissena polymorpha TaxID=45954 RepID=A0A9D4CBW7_DREPO|nr:hypothetical protein DPMN_064236 [Dreissena polymorpha]
MALLSSGKYINNLSQIDSRSRCKFNRAGPDMRSVPMVLRRYVFTCHFVQKDLSAVAVDNGMQSRTRRHCMFCSPISSVPRASVAKFS